MITITTLLLLIAVILFGVDVWRSKSLVSAGLFCWSLSQLVGSLLIR